jgi:hypothetical protein
MIIMVAPLPAFVCYHIWRASRVHRVAGLHARVIAVDLGQVILLRIHVLIVAHAVDLVLLVPILQYHWVL